MNEIVPVVLGALLGFLIWHLKPGRPSIVLSICAVAVSGALATVFSDEYRESWIYLLLDLGEAALGLAAGFSAAYATMRLRKPRSAPRTSSEG